MDGDGYVVCERAVDSFFPEVLLKDIWLAPNSVRISMLFPMISHLMTFEKFLARVRGPELREWAP